jgi:outer membrane receptor protein involved in Fe transport
MREGVRGASSAKRRNVLAFLLTNLGLIPSVWAQNQDSGAPSPSPAEPKETGTEPPLEVTVEGERAAAASRVHTGYHELQLRPKARPGDVFETVPGLFAVQHSGGGKANQWFLRGFDADHGTDVALFVDGVPINFVSHGHGQGYSDIHFLIPELAVSIDGYKGPYYARFGDFATAGAVEVRLAESLPESSAQYSIGQYGVMRGLVMASPKLAEDWRLLLAADLYRDDGPFVNPEKLKRFNVFARTTHDLDSNSKVSLTWMSYGSRWNGSGQIPARAVCGEGENGAAPPEDFDEPCIDHFGYVDPSEGGATQRHQASVAYSTRTRDSELKALLYAIGYRFSLYSNFTFFADDPLSGDEIEQADDRTVIGADFSLKRRHRLGPLELGTTFGLQVRSDAIDNALYHDVSRERLDSRVNAHINESSIGVYVEEEAKVSKALRFVAGLRGDRFDVNVEDRLEDTTAIGDRTSGTKGSTRFSPKLMLVVSPIEQLDLFADYGLGFHSNDARGAVRSTNAATLLTQAQGYELGARERPHKDLELFGAVFLLDLDSELVWSGDAGTTEASAASRRYGVELGARYRISNWLFADIDATFTRARFRENAGNGNAVALAPTRTLTAGVEATQTFDRYKPFAALRLKSIADRPAIEDKSLTAEGFTIVNAEAGVRWWDLELRADVQNLFDAKWREVNFANESRLSYESEPVNGIHYSPGWPRTILASARLYWR